MASSNVTINFNFDANFIIKLMIRYTMHEFNMTKQQATRKVIHYMNRSKDYE